MANSYWNNTQVNGDAFTETQLEAIEDGFDAVEADFGEKVAVQNGFINRTDSDISFVDGTRTFTIEPAVTSFSFYSGGSLYTKSAAETAVIDDTEGTWFFYYDASGVLQKTQTFSDAIITDYALIALLYWDATNNTAITLAEERHGRDMPGTTHLYLHNTSGTKYGSGLQPTGVTVDGDGDSAVHAQIGVGSGTIWDEDIEITIAADAVPSTVPILYRSGATGLWRKIAATNFVVTTTGTGRAAYNEWTGATWQLTEVTSNDFMCMHLYATNDVTEGYFWICGQETYSTAGSAREGALSELLALETNGLPIVEYKSVATFIIQTSAGYTNTVKSRIISTDTGADYIDWRFTDVGLALNVSGATNPLWGDITGTLANQTDLQAALDASSGGMTALYKSANYTLTADDLVYSEAGLTHTLPATPTTGDMCSVWDMSDNAGASAITVLRNGKTINGVADDFSLNMDGGRVDFMYDGTGWIYSYVVQTVQSKYIQTRSVTGTTDTLLSSDNGKEIIYTNAAAIAVTLPDDFPEGWNCVITQTTAAGVPTVTPNTDTINGAGTGVAPSGQWKGMVLSKYSSTAYIAKI